MVPKGLRPPTWGFCFPSRSARPGSRVGGPLSASQEGRRSPHARRTISVTSEQEWGIWNRWSFAPRRRRI